MYEDHLTCQPPPDDAVLWRYMDFTKFVSLLESQSLFFCRADLLGDPFEGSIPQVRHLPENLQKLIEDRFSIHQIDNRQITRMIYANCWHSGEFESEAMWRIYARKHDGIAIRTPFQNFRKALIGKEIVYVSKIQYINYRADTIPSGNAIFPFIYKRISFQHEQEVRALILQAVDEGELIPEGICYKIDLKQLIEEIVVAPFAEPWFFELVESLANRYGLGDRIRKSELADTPNFIARYAIPKDT
ncbi:MAG: DUF2971 domain-containing protein [Thiotrichales bacterium]|nr:DUF2971 domain-containing protein [Thiotrichales bacterium]